MEAYTVAKYVNIIISSYISTIPEGPKKNYTLCNLVSATRAI